MTLKGKVKMYFSAVKEKSVSQHVHMHSLVGLQPQFDYAAQSDNCNYLSIHAGEKIKLLAEACHPGTLSGAEPISTSGNKATSG